VKTVKSFSIYLRILVISLFIALLGLAPHPHAATRDLENASQSIRRGNLLTASKALAGVAEYFPWRYELNLTAGRFAMQAGDPKQAIQYLERPGAISHLSYDDMILLGDAYNQSGDPFMAEAIWKRVTELNGSNQAHERLAKLYLKRKDYPQAMTELQNILSQNPADIPLYYQIGCLYAVIDPSKSLPFLIQAAEIDPNNGIHAQTLHDKIRTAGLFDEPSYTLLIAGRQLADWGEWELAVEAFHNATVLRPGYSDAWAFLGEARQQLSLWETNLVSDTGFAELEYAIHIEPRSALANTFMGLYWERRDDYSQANNYIEQAIAASPNDPFLYAEHGNILAKMGDLPAAQSAYEAAIQLTPRDSLFYRMLAEFALQYQIQIRELALPAARQAINLDPGNASALDVMAQVMLMLEDYHSAERFAQRAVQADPGFAAAYLHLGIAYVYLQEPDLARQWLNQAQAANPDSGIASQAKRMLEYYFP
jgi:tetratricopeptide (TPR) repeat protein